MPGSDSGTHGASAVNRSATHQDPRSVTLSETRLALLLEVGEALSSTDDPDQAVGLLARVIVPQLADWSFITVIDEEGDLRDIGLAHRDPAKEDDLRVYSDCHLQHMTDVAAVSVGIRTGQPVVVPHLDDKMLQAFLPDPDVAYLTRRLDPHGVAVFPLQASGHTFGVLVSVTTTPRGSHTPEELTSLLEVARRAGPVLAAARSARRARVVAETMQRSLLHVSEPGSDLEVSMRYRPAYSDREVGGDWYDVFTLTDGSTLVTIGDVMGHDLRAVAAMAQLRTLMRANAWTLQHSPAEVLSATDAVSSALGPATFATVLSAQLAPASSPGGAVEIEWSNAGHPLPLLIAPNGDASFLGAEFVPDPPLGVGPDIPRVNHVASLAPGSVVLLYTDGLVERRGTNIDDRLIRLVEQAPSFSLTDVEAFADDVLRTMDADSAHDDDIAVMVIRVAHLP